MASLIPDSFVLIVITLWAYLYDVKGLCSRRLVLSALAHKLSDVRIWTWRHDADAFANEGSHATHRVRLGQVRPSGSDQAFTASRFLFRRPLRRVRRVAVL